MYIDTKQILSDMKFYEGYSRFIENENRYETWDESVDRVMNMHTDYFTSLGKMTPELQKRIAKASVAYKNKVFLGAQRALQFGGPQLLKNQAKLYNCVSSYADRPAFFGEAFYLALCGCGVGFSVQYCHIDKLPIIISRPKTAKVHVIEDSIQGWASALDVMMASFFKNGGKHPQYAGHKIYFDYSQIRKKGELISGGFKAPGPEPLQKALNKIENMLIAIGEQKRKMKPIEVYDIIMHMADAVISGGVRRSATICLFSPEDEEMASAKTGNWFIDNPQRGRSNNSAVLVRSKVTKEQFDDLMVKVRSFGEPGFYFTEHEDITTNPCVEIGMYPQYEGISGWQGCNLVEINGSLCSTEDEFLYACEQAAFIGTLQAAYTNFNFLDEVSKKIFDREALLGVSITGWMNNPEILFDENILAKGVEVIRKVNKETAKLIGINPAARLTCTKPSGNASVLLKTASGIHGEHSPLYIRHVQINKESNVAKAIFDNFNDVIEESVWSTNKTDYVVSFPCVSKETSIYKNSLIGVKQLEYVKKAQQFWVDKGTNLEYSVNKDVRHNISNTIQVDNWDEVAEYIWDNRHIFAGVSLLGLSGDKDYAQAPFTEVLTEDKILATYGVASMFASGLIVDSIHAYGNLWIACNYVGNDAQIQENDTNNALKNDWVRRFIKFAENYYAGDLKKAEYCLKDVHNLHKWMKLQKTFSKNLTINWNDYLVETLIDVDTMGAQACAGGACEI